MLQWIKTKLLACLMVNTFLERDQILFQVLFNSGNFCSLEHQYSLMHILLDLYKSQQLCVLTCTSMVILSRRSQTLRFRYLDAANYVGTSCLSFVSPNGNPAEAADRLPTALSSSSHSPTAACMRNSKLYWVCLMAFECSAWCPAEAWEVMGLLCNVCNICHLCAVLPGVLWHLQWHLVSTFGKLIRKFIFSD